MSITISSISVSVSATTCELKPVHKVHDDRPVLQLVSLQYMVHNGGLVGELLETAATSVVSEVQGVVREE